MMIAYCYVCLCVFWADLMLNFSGLVTAMVRLNSSSFSFVAYVGVRMDTYLIFRLVCV